MGDIIEGYHVPEDDDSGYFIEKDNINDALIRMLTEENKRLKNDVEWLKILIDRMMKETPDANRS